MEKLNPKKDEVLNTIDILIEKCLLSPCGLGEYFSKSLAYMQDPKKVEKLKKSRNHNLLGSVFLKSDQFEKSKTHFLKSLSLSIESGVLFTNPLMNLANLLCQFKEFETAAIVFELLILMNPHKYLVASYPLDSYSFPYLSKYMQFSQQFDTLTLSSPDLVNSVRKEISRSQKRCPTLSTLLVSKKMNSKEAFVDAHSNLGFTLLGLQDSENSFKILDVVLKLEKGNKEAQINLGTVLRQMDRQKEAIELVWRGVREDVREDLGETRAADLLQRMRPIDASSKGELECIGDPPSSKYDLFCFYCVKWGTKYGPEYANKLFKGVQRFFDKKCLFFCLTDDPSGLHPSIIPLPLDPSLKTWWTKACLFSEKFVKAPFQKEPEHAIFKATNILNVYIDLDVVITGDLSYLSDFQGKFGILNTENIFCEIKTADCYNSSVVLWRGFEFSKIYDLLIDLKKYVMNYLFRFDFWLEMMVVHASILQKNFPGKIKDFRQECQSEELPPDTSIVIFPRDPKPHECDQKWVKEFWV